MGRFLDPSTWAASARAFREARPFPHAVIDGFARPERLAELALAFEDEPAEEIHDEIFSTMASNRRLEHATFRAFEEELGGHEVLEVVGAFAGTEVSRVELRAYVYLDGHYLLPHADHQPAVGRALALAFYVDARDLEGGELELFDCDLGRRGDGSASRSGGDREIVRARPDRRIEAIPNRAVIFEVGDRSLHQVREVIRGARLSLAGWFYP